MRHADTALYAGKDAGRNRVIRLRGRGGAAEAVGTVAGLHGARTRA